MPGPLAPHQQRKLPLPPPDAASVVARSTKEECAQLHAYLKLRGHVGSVNGITRKVLRPLLAAHLGRRIADRVLQRIVSDAPNYGYPVASNSRTGYFVVESVEEFDACISELESRAREHQWRAASLRALCPQPMDPRRPGEIAYDD